jgi:tripartite-type tricarboxylate transporter receptor subunit TctC
MVRYYGSLRSMTMAVAGFAVAISLMTAPVGAADFPQKGKTVQMLIGFAAGGSSDVGARILASGLEKELGTSVMVVNKPGASSQIAYTALTQAKPDGYTIGNTNFPSAIVSYLDPTRKATYTRKDYELLALHVIDPSLRRQGGQSLQDPQGGDRCRQGESAETPGLDDRDSER